MKKRIMALFVITTVLSLSLISFGDFYVNPNETYFKWPTISKRITAPFGVPRPHGYHKGIDIGATQAGVAGDRVSAIEDGKVMLSKNMGYANVVAVNHHASLNGVTNKHLQSVYVHGSNLRVNEGDVVYRGQLLCDMDGTFGFTPHLHFEMREIDSYTQPYVWSGGVPVNPLAFYSDYGPRNVLTSNEIYFTEKLASDDDSADEYSHAHGIIKDDRLYTVDYLLNMTADELNAAHISNEELLILSDKIKSFDLKSANKIKRMIK